MKFYCRLYIISFFLLFFFGGGERDYTGGERKFRVLPSSVGSNIFYVCTARGANFMLTVYRLEVEIMPSIWKQ